MKGQIMLEFDQELEEEIPAEEIVGPIPVPEDWEGSYEEWIEYIF